MCEGIPNCIPSSDQLKKHVIYKTFHPHSNDKLIDNSDMVLSGESDDEYVDINSNNQVEFTRSIDCYCFVPKSRLKHSSISIIDKNN